MLHFYVPFASCYHLPGSSAGERGFSEILGESGPDLEGVRYVCLPHRCRPQKKGWDKIRRPLDDLEMGGRKVG